MREEIFEARRRELLRWLIAGGALGAPLAGSVRAQQLLGQVPGPLPAGRSIYRLAGEVRVNDILADIDTPIAAGDTLTTGPGAELVYAVGKDAFLLRGESRVEMEPAEDDSRLVEGLRVLTGRLLSVFGRRRHRLTTNLATIGIRGTGLYVEARAEVTYACTCYGETDLMVTDRPSATETIVSERHDAPRYITGGADGAIEPAPFINHTDEELTLIEALVGREPPFGPALGDDYTRPRRGRY